MTKGLNVILQLNVPLPDDVTWLASHSCILKLNTDSRIEWDTKLLSQILDEQLEGTPIRLLSKKRLIVYYLKPDGSIIQP